MDSREQGVDRIKYLVEKLRYITLAVQIIPFAYSALYIICLVLYLFCPEPILRVLDSLFYVSPIVVIGFLIEAKVLKLCVWYRCACILPILPQIVVFIDNHIVQLVEVERYIAIGTPILLSFLLLIAAYHIFIR